MAKIMITGVSGLLGSHLLTALLERGHEVVGVDNLSRGRKENLTPYLSHPRFVFHQTDILDYAGLLALSEGVKTIFHLAHYKVPRYSTALTTLEVNAKGTLNVLQAADKLGARVIYGSTSAVYGKNSDRLLSESSPLILGQTNINRWSDAASKVMAEHFCFAFRERSGMPITILRYFDVYGPGQRRDWWGGAIAVFIEAALNRQPITIHGEGYQTRSYMYIADAVEGTLKVLDSPYTEGEILNIGAPQEISIINLAYLIWRLVGNPEKIKLDYVPYTDFSRGYEDVVHRRPDHNKARFLLGFEPRTDLETGLKNTIDWHRGLLNNSQP